MAGTTTPAEHDALKALFRLTQDHEAVRTGDLAAALGLTAGTVTTRVKRLALRGFVTHAPYQGVVLTQDGRRHAVSAIRRHRLVERFLADMLGYPWERADQLAATFEHELPDEVVERIDVALDRPTTCPHGFPIPSPQVASIEPMPPLYALEPGEVAVVAVPGAADADVVAFLDGLGLRPGVRVEVKEKHPFDGPIVLHVDGKDRTVGHRLAHEIFVRRTAVTTTPDVTNPDVANPVVPIQE